MAAPITVNSQIKLNNQNPSIDWKYGPYSSLEEAYTALGPDGADCICVGLTVGITISETEVVEYWFKGGVALENLVVKASKIDVDAELSEESSNPIANSVVTKAISDNKITIDTELNSGSSNPVANSVVTKEFNSIVVTKTKPGSGAPIWSYDDYGATFQRDKYILSKNGSIASGTTDSGYFCSSEYIPVTAGKTYYFFWNKESVRIRFVAYYDSSYGFISGDQTSLYNNITAPEGASYVRFGFVASLLGTTGADVSIVDGLVVVPDISGFEMFQQTNPAYVEPEPAVEYKALSDDLVLNGDSIEDQTVSAAKCDFMIDKGVVNLFNHDNAISGYLYPDTWGQVYSNEIYETVFIDIEVTAGDVITFWNLTQSEVTPTQVICRFLFGYDSSYTIVSSEKESQIKSYTVPVGVSYIAVTYQASYGANFYIQRSTTEDWMGKMEYGEHLYKVSTDIVEESEPTLHIIMPPEICIPAGQTIEIYNNCVCLEADKYHVKWECDNNEIGGIAYIRKYQVTGQESTVGQTGTLTMYLYDDDLKLVAYASTTIEIVAADVTTDQNILIIGDSLTNGKYWQVYIRDVLSAGGHIFWRGTRGHTSPAYVKSGYNHEGRSGAGSSWYNYGTSIYGFDKSCTTLITSTGSYAYMIDSSGATIDPIDCNPFWHRTEDGSTNKFDFDWYCNTLEEGGAGIHQDADGNAESLTPSAIMIYLGANGLALDASSAVTAIKTLVDNIRNSIKGATVPIYLVTLQTRPPFIGVVASDGFADNINTYKFEDDVKHFNLIFGLIDTFSSYENLYFIPIYHTFDAIYGYPYELTSENPYSTAEDAKTFRRYTDTIHPLNTADGVGYKQMAVTMWGSLVKHQG